MGQHDHNELATKIQKAKEQLGSQVYILGHHYQPKEILTHVDAVGDSLDLAQRAQAEKNAPYIVFCGVRFMAETADILTSDDQVVLLPNSNAGCPLADMATGDALNDAWKRLTAALGHDITPIAYVNSSAEVKAFCGEHGGLTCTSSSAPTVFQHAFESSEHILFLPDQNLGYNVARQIGIPPEAIQRQDTIGEHVSSAAPRVIVWNGHCYVHTVFTTEHIKQTREEHPEVKIIVHPECPPEVVERADDVGSTAHIRTQVLAAPTGSVWAIGTEINLVDALRRQCPDQTILSLNGTGSACEDMHRITPSDLHSTLAGLTQGQVMNQVQVPPDIRPTARKALERMLLLS